MIENQINSKAFRFFRAALALAGLTFYLCLAVTLPDLSLGAYPSTATALGWFVSGLTCLPLQPVLDEVKDRQEKLIDFQTLLGVADRTDLLFRIQDRLDSLALPEYLEL